MENKKDIAPINEDLNVANYEVEEIKQKIYLIRGKQVMIDSDVAKFYHYTTKNINKAMKRNIERFPEDFCFKLTEEEFQDLRFHFGTLNRKVNNGKTTRKYLPYVYTEQGIAMLSGLLKNEISIQISIYIMRAFIEMRKFFNNNKMLFEKINNIELNQLEFKKITNEKFETIFKYIEDHEEVKQRIFFEGQIWDAYSLIIELIKKAKEKIVIIDNYIDDSILEMLSKKQKNVEAIIFTSNKSNISKLDIQKFNKEYPVLKVIKSDKFHDRFIAIDNKELYHVGASLKDLGKKCFAITKMEDTSFINKIEENT